jgi:KilA-N domain
MPENVESKSKTSRRGSLHLTTRDVNGVSIEQRMHDGFINATAMSVAYGKKLDSWLRTQDALDTFLALADDLGVNYSDLSNLDAAGLSARKYMQIFPQLIISKGGSPETGGGTWLHPDIAIYTAQWCYKPFAIKVSRWVREWMTSAYNPIQLEADADRVAIRDDLGKVKRLELTDQVKSFLEKAGKYDLKNPKTRFYFTNAHDKLNKVITGETSKAMRLRLGEELGCAVSEVELIRDYFPIKDLVNYANLCQAAANEMEINGTPPLEAIDIAAKWIFPSKFAPKQITFTERIDLVRRRLVHRDQLLLGGAIPILGEVG